MAVKQRVIWMDDTDWAHLHLMAGQVGLNPSQYIRQVMRRPEIGKTLGMEMDAHDAAVAAVKRPLSQGERDAILKKVNTKK